MAKLKPRRSQTAKEVKQCIARLLALGGIAEAGAVVFGPIGQVQLRFRPTVAKRKGKRMFIVGFSSPVGSDEIKAQLNRANRQLWDKSNDQPCAEYSAICDAAGALAQVGDLPTNKPVEPHFVSQMYYALENLLACCSNGRKLAIAWIVYEQLRQEASAQPPAFFDAVSESPNVRRLKKATLDLALKLERPPSKRELREESGWRQDQQKEFNLFLRRAGLVWLPARWN